jgi:hypothetical protein
MIIAKEFAGREELTKRALSISMHALIAHYLERNPDTINQYLTPGLEIQKGYSRSDQSPFSAESNWRCFNPKAPVKPENQATPSCWVYDQYVGEFDLTATAKTLKGHPVTPIFNQ